MIPRTMIAVALLGTLSLATPASAGGRWLIGLDGLSSRVEDNDAEDALSVEEQADGVGLQIGYNLNPNFMLRLYVGGADHATSDEDLEIVFAGGLLEAVYVFRAGRALRPYVFGGIGGFGIESRQDHLTYQAEGVATGFGVGAFYDLGRRFALHGSLRLEAVNWETVNVTYHQDGGSELIIETPVEDSGLATKATLGFVIRL